MYVGFQPNDGVRKFPSSPELAADSQPDAPRNFASGITPGSVGEDVETPDLIHSERRITLEVKQASTSEAGGTMVQIPFEGSSPGPIVCETSSTAFSGVREELKGHSDGTSLPLNYLQGCADTTIMSSSSGLVPKLIGDNTVWYKEESQGFSTMHVM
eukprot:CAMPEP_0114266230 /NCGR_PEP_ID=MMETSP0058-20121206/24490_1 /TAXON_ID=36894 /ORGANISM="Pyramimonas parkeae, CCMP726" /LENGTH=156 /DNA_ID=CAMNT_0001383679 /DNA_START=169 /DNA_END=639 /DNA_ORIENTATION=+